MDALPAELVYGIALCVYRRAGVKSVYTFARSSRWTWVCSHRIRRLALREHVAATKIQRMWREKRTTCTGPKVNGYPKALHYLSTHHLEDGTKKRCLVPFRLRAFEAVFPSEWWDCNYASRQLSISRYGDMISRIRVTVPISASTIRITTNGSTIYTWKIPSYLRAGSTCELLLDPPLVLTPLYFSHTVLHVDDVPESERDVHVFRAIKYTFLPQYMRNCVVRNRISTPRLEYVDGLVAPSKPLVRTTELLVKDYDSPWLGTPFQHYVRPPNQIMALEDADYVRQQLLANGC